MVGILKHVWWSPMLLLVVACVKIDLAAFIPLLNLMAKIL